MRFRRGAAPAIVVPPPVAPSGEPAAERERLAVAYTPDVKAKGLDVVCAAWADAGLEDARLLVFGVERDRAMAHLHRTGVPAPAGVEFLGKTPPAEFRAALRRARAYVGGARWEDFGMAPLEALADGALLVTVPSGGPFEALALARRLAPELVAEQVAAGSAGGGGAYRVRALRREGDALPGGGGEAHRALPARGRAESGDGGGSAGAARPGSARDVTGPVRPYERRFRTRWPRRAARLAGRSSSSP